jgi:PKD repeat protein
MKSPRLYIFLYAFLLLISAVPAFSQTITVTNFDTTIPYSPGSSIAVPIHIDNPANLCIAQSNTFNLYLSNAAGVYPATPLATVTGFYATFINSTIPAGTLPGVGYKVKVTASSNPGATIVESAPFTIVAGSAVQAGINDIAGPIGTDAFGKCDKPSATYQFTYINTSTAGATGTATFVDESGAAANTTINALNGNFVAGQTNYTVIVKATNGKVYGTHAYTLINNTVNNNIGSSSSTSGCLSAVGNSVTLAYTLNANQLLSNYPGDTYKVTWGDGTGSTIFTICDIVASNGIVSHTYYKSSCGNTPSVGRNNVFEIDIQPYSPFCGAGAIGTLSSTYANITLAPQNQISGPIAHSTCAGPVVFSNSSYPGEDPASTSNKCVNFAGALYTWFVDGTATLIRVPITTNFTPVLTSGNHIISLRLTNNQTICNVDDAVFNICVQNAPTPNFTLSAGEICAAAGVAITNTTVFDNTCTPPVYNWAVTAPAGATAVTTTGGTDFHSAQPQFVFTTAGTYTLTLTMPDACGVNHSKSATLIVDNTPTVALSPNIALCGAQTLTFNNTIGNSTRVTYAGAGNPASAIYNWTVTPAGGAPAIFVNGTSAASQYPQITFPGYGAYTVTVNYTVACNTVSATQLITIQQAPTVSAGNNASVCASSGTYQLNGSISDLTNVTSYQWKTSGDGTFNNSTSTLSPVYTLGTNDKKGGNVVITLAVNTTLAGACAAIPQTVTLAVVPVDVVTSAPAQNICSGNVLNYAITAATAGSTFTWTATGTATITGFTANGSGGTITDVLTNSDPINSGTVVYTITPSANGCTGTPFNLTVTISPKPVITLTDVSICSGKPTGVALTNTLKYIWVSSITSGSATGNTQQATVASVSTIADVLTNTGTLLAVVKYTVTPINSNGCAGTPVNVNVTIQAAPTQPAAISAVAICNATSYQLNGTVPVVGTGQWTETTGKAVTFNNPTSPSATVSGLVPGLTYNFTWAISTGCNTNSTSFQLTDDLPSVGGIAATAINPICFGSTGTVTLSGNLGNITAWQQSTDSGTTWQTFAGTNTAPTYNYAALTQTTAFRAVVVNGSCTIAYSAQVNVIVNPATVVPNAGPDQTLCNQTTTILQGNSPGTSSGLWTLKSGTAAGVVITTPTLPTTTVTGLTGGNSYTFTWTIAGAPPCGNLFDDVVITDQSTITNTISTASASVCTGANVNLTGSAPTGGAPPYTYVWESSTDNGTTWAAIGGQTSQSAAVVVLTSTMYRRTVYSNLQLCNSISNIINIVTQSPVGNNIISSPSGTLCYNTAPAIITGTAPTGGDGIYFYRWQQSTDGGITFTDVGGAVLKDYQPPALTINTIYRRIVSTTLCSGALSNSSNSVAITVTPLLNAIFTAVTQASCAPFTLTAANISATPDNNAQSYTWYADGAVIGSGITFPGYTIATEGTKVTIKLVLTSALGCPSASYSVDFSTSKQAVASFTMDKTSGCGPQTVNFVNTSTPLNGTVFTWSFGDGSANYVGVTPPPHTFQPDPSGNDVTYKITLTPQGCSPVVTTNVITLYPAKPVPIIDPGPSNGCSPYSITAKNLSLGTNSNYTFYLYDDNNTLVQTILKTDKSDAVFNPINAATTTKIYTVYMVATNLCGVTNKSVVYPITIAPSGITARMNITPVNFAGIAAGCAPYLATFHNLSTGGTSYVYNVYDSNFVPIVSIINNNPASIQDYSFATPGTYYVSIGVFSNCSTGVESQKIPVVVYPVPAPDFVADVTTACTQLTVNFTNNTPGLANAPATSYNYTWDFGDGTISNVFSPTHTFNYKNSPFTVTLTAVNGNGCVVATAKAAYIMVNPPPGTDFAAQPDTITSIPNYTFSFIDRSNVPCVSWFWDFGDKTTSTRQAPTHTYADTGAYKVTLTTYTQYGCTGTKTHLVRITGVPGQLYVPNAFMPSSLKQELQSFTVKGSGLAQWDMRIFNNWGQLVFETTKLGSKGEPLEFWDGKFKGQNAQQGVYAWEISATFINGTDWKGMSYNGSSPKKAGTLTLIR